ncbi:DUF805 domain-containing protein [Lacticaseibacillus porcinae]|uniref:DUF805 domain-containing protein n=1 Tax=Lacticaseibacillus porcinae TaxID=1123687 RepID=UPI000F78F560|nr:DUF805 domain-containing protein [Lacticaseibacillus porcinae]
MKPVFNEHYGASGWKAFLAFWQNYANFKGRSTRSEYWWSTLFLTIVLTAVFLLSFVWLLFAALRSPETFTAKFSFYDLWPLLIVAIMVLSMAIPSFAIAVRRFRDAGVHWGVFLTFQITGIVVSVIPQILWRLGLVTTNLSQSWWVTLLSWGMMLTMLVIEILPSKPLPEK